MIATTFNIEKCINNALRKASLRGKAISHDRLAAEAGISKQTLYNIFARDDAKLSQLNGLAKALGVSIYETFEVDEEDWAKFITAKSGSSLVSKPHPDYSHKLKDLEEKNALYEDYIQSLKKHISSLEREVDRLHGEKVRDEPGA